MKFKVDAEGFEGRQIVVTGPGIVTPPKLYIDGEEASKGANRREYILHCNDGFKVIAEVRSVFLDQAPKLIIDGKTYKLADPLTPFQWIWSGLPIVLVFVGGMIGGILGAVTFWANTGIFRSDEIGPFEKYILTGAVSLIAGLVWFIISYGLRGALF